MTHQLAGLHKGLLLVTGKKGKDSKSGKIIWNCKCLCGNTTELPTHELIRLSGTKSCGRCEWHINHKDAYTSWMAMKQRCDDSSRKDYKYYGGRGIAYDLRWVEFVEFFKDMGDPFRCNFTQERHSLERLDVNGDYCKANCVWADSFDQANNKRISKSE